MTVQIKLIVNEDWTRTHHNICETEQEHKYQYAAHARTMCMMYRATGDNKYLTRARHDIDKAKSLRGGFKRPLGAILKEAS